jgi:hypothetical protein
MVFNTADAGSFRAVLSGNFYRRWRNELGETAWRLLEQAVGRPL